MNIQNFKERLKQFILGYSHFTPSFSQSGEDMNLLGIFRNIKNGFFVDIGAYHPVIGSNTNYLYRFMGWTGINIEPNPNNFQWFEKLRLRDINLNMGISGNKKNLDYHMIDAIPTMNSFSLDFIRKHHMEGNISRTIKVPTGTLSGILDTYLPAGRQIDIMNIDVEGMDIEVLQSNDWAKYKPRCIVIEVDNDEIFSGPIHDFLTKNGYILKGLTPVNTQINSSCIYMEETWAKTFHNY